MHARIFQTEKESYHFAPMSFQPILCETQNEIFGIIKVDAVYTAMHTFFFYTIYIALVFYIPSLLKLYNIFVGEYIMTKFSF